MELSMMHNEIKWNKLLEESESEKRVEKFIILVKNLLNEGNSKKNCDEILYGIDKILSSMTENEEKEAQNLLNKILKEVK